MKTPIFAIKDKLVGYGQPFTAYSEEVAKRDFINAMKNNPCAEDMELYYIGEYDSEDAYIETVEENKLIMKGDSINEV